MNKRNYISIPRAQERGCHNRHYLANVTDVMEDLAQSGVRFTLTDIIERFILPTFQLPTSEKEVGAKLLAKRCLLTLRQRFKKKELWFGTINNYNQYGFIVSSKERKFVNERKLRREKGLIENFLKLESTVIESGSN